MTLFRHEPCEHGNEGACDWTGLINTEDGTERVDCPGGSVSPATIDYETAAQKVYQRRYWGNHPPSQNDAYWARAQDEARAIVDAALHQTGDTK